MYHARRFFKKRSKETYEDDFFVRSGLNDNLEYGMRVFDDDFLSVDNSFYGSTANWNGEEFDKFDVSSQNSEEDLLDI